MIKEFVTESLHAEPAAFLCAGETIFQVVCPHFREREGKREGKEGKRRQEARREGRDVTVATESAHEPAADKTRRAARTLAAPACSVKQQNKSLGDRRNPECRYFFLLLLFFSWKRIYHARFWLSLNTHTWLNTNEINFPAAIFPHFAHGDLLKGALSQGVKKEHKT